MRSPAPPQPERVLLDAVPAGLARDALALPVARAGGVLYVRSRSGDDSDPALDPLRVHADAADVVATADADVVRHLLAAYARHRLPDAVEDPVLLLDVLLDLAAGSDASDLHLAAVSGGMRVHQRIDGLLHPVIHLPAATVRPLVARTKVRAGLDVAERRLPQDGRLTHELPDGSLDVRVATMPVHDGERLTLRLLPAGPTTVRPDRLGLDTSDVAALTAACDAADGLVIVCGPTGSGKTTTLHALLGRLADGARNVMTLEDPVERVVPGTSQTQVAPDRGLDFATGLRHVLRHDPDVLLVGEVRDRETARLAVEAAQTGHLVLTSVHALDAPAALVRLHELGVAPGLLADTVRLVVAQRLLPVPCPDCDGRGAACAACAGTGTRGREAVAELLTPDAGLRRRLRTGRGPGAHHDALAGAVGRRLRTAALARAADGRARVTDAVHVTPAPESARGPAP